MRSISIDIPVSSLVWLATCRPEDAASFLRLLLAMSTTGRTPSPSISRAAIPPTVDMTGLVSAGLVIMDDQTVTMPHLRKLAVDREANTERQREARQRRDKGATKARHERDNSATPLAPLSPPHTPPLTPKPPEVNINAGAREVCWAKDLLAEATRMLGRQPTGSETHRLVSKIAELEGTDNFVVDGVMSQAGSVYVACLRWVTDVKGVNSGVVPWLNYTETIFDQCRRTGLGPGKMKRANPGGNTIVGGEVSTDLESKLAAKLAAKNGGIK